MGHQETYRQNEAYSEFLAAWDENFYAKYADALKRVSGAVNRARVTLPRQKYAPPPPQSKVDPSALTPVRWFAFRQPPSFRTAASSS